jgi:hypothetical protein
MSINVNKVSFGNNSVERRTTGLHEACYLGERDKVIEFIRKGADIGAKDGFGMTPLHWATVGGQVEVIKLLTDRTVFQVVSERSEKDLRPKLFAKTPNGQTAHSLAKAWAPYKETCKVVCTPALEALRKAERSIPDCKARQKVSNSCHVRSTEDFAYEGEFRSTRVQRYQDVAHMLSSTDNDVAIIPKKDRDKIAPAFQQASEIILKKPAASKLKKMAQAIRAGELVVIPTGYIGHAMSLVFSKVGNEGYMAICNGGPTGNVQDIRGQIPTIEVFQIDPMLMHAGIIKEILMIARSFPCDRACEYLYNTLPKALNEGMSIRPRTQNEVTLFRDPFSDLFRKDFPARQDTGRCVIASVELALFFSWVSLQESSKVGHMYGKMRVLHEKLCHQMAQKALDDYVRDTAHKDRDQYLIEESARQLRSRAT